MAVTTGSIEDKPVKLNGDHILEQMVQLAEHRRLSEALSQFDQILNLEISDEKMELLDLKQILFSFNRFLIETIMTFKLE